MKHGFGLFDPEFSRMCPWFLFINPSSGFSKLKILVVFLLPNYFCPSSPDLHYGFSDSNYRLLPYIIYYFHNNEYTVSQLTLNLPFIHGPFWLFKTESKYCVIQWILTSQSLRPLDVFQSEPIRFWCSHSLCRITKHVFAELFTCETLLPSCILYNSWILSLYRV